MPAVLCSHSPPALNMASNIGYVTESSGTGAASISALRFSMMAAKPFTSSLDRSRLSSTSSCLKTSCVAHRVSGAAA